MELWKGFRSRLANCVWWIAHRIYPFAPYKDDDPEVYLWRMEATYRGTAAEADEWFEKLCELDCADKQPVHDCQFVIGGMRRESLDDVGDDDVTTTSNGSARFEVIDG